MSATWYDTPLYRAIRALYPNSRRYDPVGIVRNGSHVRVVQCIRCGESESCCNQYPETLRVRRFRAEHNYRCGAEILAEAGVTS